MRLAVIALCWCTIHSAHGCDVAEYLPQKGIHIPAIEKWDNSYIEEILGDQLVEVWHTPNNMKCSNNDKYVYDCKKTYVEMNISSYFENTTSYYFRETTSKLGSLYDDLQNDAHDDPHMETLYIGDHPTHYHIHIMKSDVIYCQIRGKKTFWMFDYRVINPLLHMQMPWSYFQNRLFELPEDVQIHEYVVHTGDCLSHVWKELDHGKVHKKKQRRATRMVWL